jgi:UDP-glucose 4-epimerase
MTDWRSVRVLITGGLGFLGSNLCHRLVAAGADVTLLDNLAPLYGGNRFNIDGLEAQVRVVIGDARDRELLQPLVATADVVFHLAAQVSYIDSLAMPHEDLDLNAGMTLGLLEACRHANPRARVVFSSSRMVIGRTQAPLLHEDLVPAPLSLYGIHKLACEHYLRMYHANFGIPCVIARITNPYGPRQHIKHDKYSLVGWFVRQAMEDRVIRVFGDGSQQRDYIYADDIVEALVRLAASPEAAGQTVNVGSGTGTRFRDMVATVVGVVGSGRVEHVAWPPGYERIETGDVVADTTRLERLTGTRPVVSLADGVRRTFEYYRAHRARYVD